VDLSGSGHAEVAGCFEHGDALSVSQKNAGNFLTSCGSVGCAPWSWLGSQSVCRLVSFRGACSDISLLLELQEKQQCFQI